LKTKLYTPPLRPELVSRPRLIERLDEGARLGHKLTLISAPAGFGKTGRAALAGFKGLRTAPDGRSIIHEEVQGHLVGILAYAAQIRGDRAGVIAYSQQALAQLPAGAFAERGAVALNLGFSHLECGEIEAAHVALVEAFETAQKSGANAYVASSALFLRGQILVSQTMVLGELYLAQGDADTAALHAKVYGSQVAELKDMNVTTGIWGGWLPGVLLLPRVLLAQGKPDYYPKPVENGLKSHVLVRFNALFLSAGGFNHRLPHYPSSRYSVPGNASRTNHSACRSRRQRNP
jgi:hypothetical protein